MVPLRQFESLMRGLMDIDRVVKAQMREGPRS
jgi:hypothetical protein